jgi:hypothetical protein
METRAYTEIRAPRGGKEEREYQTVPSKKQWIYGTGRNNALVHKISHLRLRWWTHSSPGGHYLVRLQSPMISAVTNCGRWMRLNDTSSKTCNIPRPDAVLCKACMGQGRNFPRGREHSVPLAVAKVRIGCVETPA